MLSEGVATSTPAHPPEPTARLGPATWVACGAVVSALVVLQIVAVSDGLTGPVDSIVRDVAGRPKSVTVPWAGLILAVTGLRVRERWWALAAAGALDVAANVVRVAAGSTVAFGQGPTWAMAGLAFYAAVRWTGSHRAAALRSIGLGALLVVATHAGDTWLRMTTAARPFVLDEYAEVADRALGSPAWIVGNLLQHSPSAVPWLLHWVYIELPVAAIVVAVYQLGRGARPRHHIVRTFLLIGVVGPVVYLVFPVVGPMFAYGVDGEGFQLGTFWPQQLPPLSAPEPLLFDTDAPRNCMPSLHTAWALAVFLHSRRRPWWLRGMGSFWLVATVLATLGFGFHYGVDLVAGAVLCLTLDAMLRDPARGWDRARIRVTAAGWATLVGLLVGYRYLAETMAAAPEVFGPLLIGALAAVAYAYHATFFGRVRRPSRELSGDRRPTR